jgi:hypothetical protein
LHKIPDDTDCSGNGVFNLLCHELSGTIETAPFDTDQGNPFRHIAGIQRHTDFHGFPQPQSVRRNGGAAYGKLIPGNDVYRPRFRTELNRINNNQIGFPLQQRQHIDAADPAIFKTYSAEIKAPFKAGKYLEADSIIGDQFVTDAEDYCTAI